jgi:hypothetical protein
MHSAATSLRAGRARGALAGRAIGDAPGRPADDVAEADPHAGRDLASQFLWLRDQVAGQGIPS